MGKRSKDYRDGFMAGWSHALDEFRPEELLDEDDLMYEARSLADAKRSVGIRRKPKRKKSAKQKLLQTMTDRKWKSYKRKYPNGKKTWVKIRAEVSRSTLYKKKAKKL